MATVPFSFECDKASGFMMDPNEHRRVGYITDFSGLGLTAPLAKDLTISLPPTNQPPTYTPIVPVQNQNTVHVVGVLEKFEWEGSVGAPLQFDFWVSQANAFQIKALQQATLKNTIINQLGWWILDYDQETKQWYEQSYPLSSRAVTGIVAPRDNPELNVDLTPVPAKDGIDVNVYKISIQIAPGANQQYALSFANSSIQHVTKSWGLVLGNLASGQIKPVVSS